MPLCNKKVRFFLRENNREKIKSAWQRFLPSFLPFWVPNIHFYKSTMSRLWFIQETQAQLFQYHESLSGDQRSRWGNWDWDLSGGLGTALALLFLCIEQLSSIHRWRTPVLEFNWVSSLASSWLFQKKSSVKPYIPECSRNHNEQQFSPSLFSSLLLQLVLCLTHLIYLPAFSDTFPASSLTSFHPCFCCYYPENLLALIIFASCLKQ